MLSQFKQTGETAFVNDETVTDIKMKASLEKKCAVAMSGLAVGVHGPLMSRLLKSVLSAAQKKRLLVNPTLLNEPRKPTLIAANRQDNVGVESVYGGLKSRQHRFHGSVMLAFNGDGRARSRGLKTWLENGR